MRIGIDLLWVRPGICGGTESYIRNMMHGFGQYDPQNEYVLFVAKDNAETFRVYEQYPHMGLYVCPTVCASQMKRLLWENLHLDRTAHRQGVDVMFIPVYSKPRTYGSRIPYVCAIHDLQAWHYPEYFSRIRCLFMKYMWRYTCGTASQLITISEYSRQDIISHYPVAKGKCNVIYIPVDLSASGMEATQLHEKYGIEKDDYFYCVSSMLPHKNLDTLLKAMQIRKQQGHTQPLVISGVGGQKEAFRAKVAELCIEDVVVDTGFVSNEERDCLYEHCRMFLFPSVFEGFGMPTIEAMSRGKLVLTTKESCLEEVTKGKAAYVEQPYDAQEWADKIQWAMTQQGEAVEFPEYSLEYATKQTVRLFQRAQNTKYR